MSGTLFFVQILHLTDLDPQSIGNDQMSHVMRIPTFWYPTWSDTNQAVQLQKKKRKKSLNTIYLTSITQKAQKTYRRVFEGADVGVLWSYMVEETRTRGKPPTLNGRPLPCQRKWLELQKMARGLKFRIQKVEGLYCLCSKNKGADLRLCFRIYKTLVFS